MPSLITRAYLNADRLARLLLRSCEAIHRGFWLGLLDREGLDAATRSLYSRSDSYRDDSWNLSGFSHWEAEIVDRHFGAARRVAVPGAGGGREVIALAKRGVRAEGFEPDPSFVGAGCRLIAEQGLDATLQVSASSELPALCGPYDGAIVGWSSYTHIAGREARIAFLRGLAGHLQPGSPILLSFFPRPDQDRALALTWRVARLSSLLRPGRERVLRGDTLMVGYFHYFDEADIVAETQAAGLELLHFARHPYGHAVARSPASGAVVGG